MKTLFMGSKEVLKVQNIEIATIIAMPTEDNLEKTTTTEVVEVEVHKKVEEVPTEVEVLNGV